MATFPAQINGRFNKPPLRVVLYSNDAMGLGRVRRNLLIAQALAQSELGATVLLISGASEAGAFAMPPNVDCLTLPTICKKPDGKYRTKRLAAGLADLIALRSNIIRAAVEAFAPDVFIADMVPSGTEGELISTLRVLREQGEARCVLGLRDVLDAPAAARREWRTANNEQTIQDYYDAVWVYGDPTVFNLVTEYGFSDELADLVRFTGYLDQSQRLESCSTAPDDKTELLTRLGLPPGQLVLCTVGGGQDGVSLAQAFCRAELPADTNAILVTGPYMSTEVQHRLRQSASERDRLRVLSFVQDADALMRHADRVIAMGGYNTICSILSFEKPALVVPRVTPRQEQLIRATRFRALGLMDVLRPSELQPNRLTAWLARETVGPSGIRERVDFGGLAAIPVLLEQVLGSAPSQFSCAKACSDAI